MHEKVLVLFQVSFNATTIFLQLRHFLLDVFEEVRVGSIKSKLPNMASTCCCDLQGGYKPGKHGKPGNLGN